MLYSLIALLLFIFGILAIFTKEIKLKFIIFFALNIFLCMYSWSKGLQVLAIFSFVINLLPFNNYFLQIKNIKQWSVEKKYKPLNIYKILVSTVFVAFVCLSYKHKTNDIVLSETSVVSEDLYLSLFVLLFIMMIFKGSKDAND